MEVLFSTIIEDNFVSMPISRAESVPLLANLIVLSLVNHALCVCHTINIASEGVALAVFLLSLIVTLEIALVLVLLVSVKSYLLSRNVRNNSTTELAAALIGS